jgi:hypothetical protein
MTFLILLAGGVITMTITNIRLKASQKKTQENFYSTDSAMDEISAGISNLSSKASADAYQSALSLYDASLTAANASIDAKYESDFLNNMVMALTPGTGVTSGITDYEYDETILSSFLTAEEQADGVYVFHPANSNKGTMVLEGDSLVLKDVSVKKDLKEDGSYETTLTTDIRIEVPSVTTEAHSEYLSYAILADDQIVVDQKLTNVFINGSIYAGTVNRTNTDESKAGIVVDGSDVTINSAYIITRGDLAVKNGSDVVVASDGVKSYAELWAENIVTDGTNSKLDLDAHSFVADDLEINGTNNEVSLKGWYYGYNFTDNYSDDEISTSGKLNKQASYSSSISINGKKDQLDMSSLQNLILAGRTFISKKTANNEIEKNKYGSDIQNPDVELGESLAVRSAQLSYLVGAIKNATSSGYVKTASSVTCSGPTKADGTAAEYGYGTFTSGTTQVQCYFFTLSGVQYIFDYQGYISNLGLPDDSSNPLKLTSDKKWNYIEDGWLDPQSPLTMYYRPDPAKSDTYISYFYLNFSNSSAGRKAASEFYDVFFNQSTQQQIYDAINDTYLDGYGIWLNDNSDVMLASGNLMYSDQSDAQNIKVKLENPGIDPTANFIDYATTKSKTYMSLQMALIDNYSDALTSSKWRLYDDLDTNSLNDGKLTKSGKSDNTNLFDVLVDRSKLPTNPVINYYDVTKSTSSGDTTVRCAYIVSKGSVQWPDSYQNAGYSISGIDNYAIIIAAGDVEIRSSNFHGLIISGGDVSIDVQSSVYADEEVVTNAFEKDKDDRQDFYDVLSKYFRKSVDATVSGSSQTAGAEANVTYENWTKNN